MILTTFIYEEMIIWETFDIFLRSEINLALCIIPRNKSRAGEAGRRQPDEVRTSQGY